MKNIWKSFERNSFVKTLQTINDILQFLSSYLAGNHTRPFNCVKSFCYQQSQQ